MKKNTLKEEIENELITASIKALLDNSEVDFTSIEIKAKEIIDDLGVSIKEKTEDFYVDVRKYLDMSKNEYSLLPSTSMSLAVIADKIFKELGEENADLKILYIGHYQYRNIFNPSFSIVEDRQVPERFTAFCQFQGNDCCVEFRLAKKNWDVEATGKNVHLLLLELEKRVKDYIFQRYKGKSITLNLKEICLRYYAREDLVYSAKMSKKIDEMITCFKSWYKSDKLNRWGYILIGRPGTGKTTVGGLMAPIRPTDCTFLYCPAAEIGNVKDIENIFNLARLLAPTVLQIDDVDLISKDRNSGNSIGLTSALMENLDGLEDESKIFIIMTTNDPGKMEKAIINRAGRVSSKIIFDDYEECLTELINKGRVNYGLSISEKEIKNVVNALPKECRNLTPDEAINVCRRLHLLYGSVIINHDSLKRMIMETYDAFHNEDYSKSYLDFKEKVHEKAVNDSLTY